MNAFSTYTSCILLPKERQLLIKFLNDAKTICMLSLQESIQTPFSKEKLSERQFKIQENSEGMSVFNQLLAEMKKWNTVNPKLPLQLELNHIQGYFLYAHLLLVYRSNIRPYRKMSKNIKEQFEKQISKVDREQNKKIIEVYLRNKINALLLTR